VIVVFAYPLGLLALLAVPAIVALHFFRRRFQPRVVSALFLWGAPDPTPMSGRKRERLRVSGSLLCEIAAALCAAFFLAGPRGCAGESARHLVVVLDGSASMGARTPQGPTLLDLARTEIEKRIDALPSGSRVTLPLSALELRPTGNAVKITAEPFEVWGEREAVQTLAPFAIRRETQPAPWSRSVFNGYAQAIVQSAGEPGEVVLQASSPGLESASARIPAGPQ
jgi:hypothetical protein